MRPVLEYGTSCWDPYTEGQINALDLLQNKGAKFANDMKRFGLGNLGTEQEGSSHLRPVPNIHRRTGMKIYREQVKRTMPTEQR